MATRPFLMLLLIAIYLPGSLAVLTQEVDILAPCIIEGVPGEVLCGSLAVVENPDLPASRMIELNIAVLTATGTSPEPDPIFILTGGPGQSAIEGAARFAAEFAMSREHRSLVLVDQRGTGGSNPLICTPVPSGDPFTAEVVRACRQLLEQYADLTQYTTLNAVRDLEIVREALGYVRINLDAGSYGTRVALVYMKHYPLRVRSAVLRGVSPTNYRNPLPFAAAGQRALDKLFDDCAADIQCNGAFPDLHNSFKIFLERLDESPETVVIPPDSAQDSYSVLITRDLFAARIHLMLYSADLSARLPYIIHEGANGNLLPFARISEAFGRAVRSQIYFGMQLSVVCAEDIAGITDEHAREMTSGTFLGLSQINRFRSLCEEWPVARLTETFWDPVHSETPVLVISGDLDPATPPNIAAEVVRYLPSAYHLILPQSTHIINHPCVNSIVAQFLVDGSADDLDTECIGSITRPKYLIRVE